MLVAAAVPRGVGDDRQDLEGWHVRCVGLGDASAGLGRRVEGRSILLSVGGGGIFPLGQRGAGLPALAEPGDQRGRIQVDAAFMARLLISLWGGQAPTTRTYEMLCCY